MVHGVDKSNELTSETDHALSKVLVNIYDSMFLVMHHCLLPRTKTLASLVFRLSLLFFVCENAQATQQGPRKSLTFSVLDSQI